MFRINCRIIELFSLAIFVTKDPEQTRLSLLAKAIGIPFFAVLTTGINPVELIAATTISVIIKNFIVTIITINNF